MAEGKGTFVPFDQADKLWKDNIRRIVTNQLITWPTRWSFLVEEYHKMHQALEGKRVLSPIVRQTSFPCKPAKARTYLPPIHHDQAPFILPRTSNGWYGYTHLRDGHNLVSDYQQWTKSTVVQHDLLKLLKWSKDYYD